MATPIGHAIAGIAVGALASRGRPFLSRGKDLLLFGLLAQVPDLDFAAGLFAQRIDAYHHGLSHSLGAALLVGLLAALVGRARGDWLRWGIMGFGIAMSHVLLDALNVDTSFPHGVPMWWPFSSEYIILYPLYPDVWREPPWRPTIKHNLWGVFLEILTLAPLAGLALWYRKRASG